MYQYPLFPLIVNHTHTSTVLVLVTCLLQVLAYELAHRAPHVRADKGCCYVLYVVVWTVAVAAAVAVAVAVAVAAAAALVIAKRGWRKVLCHRARRQQCEQAWRRKLIVAPL